MLMIFEAIGINVEPEQLEQVAAVAAAGPAQAGGQLQVLGHGQVGDEVVGGPLEDVAEQAAAQPAQPPDREAGQPHVGNGHLPGRRGAA